MAKVSIEPGPYVLPMPLVLVGAEVDGRANFMPVAFCGIVNFQPAMVVCGLNPEHHTCRGIETNGVFSLNVPRADLVEAADWCGLQSGKRVDKSRVFEVSQGELEGVPLIDRCPMNVECRLKRTIPLGVDTLYLAEVVAVHADEDVLEGEELRWERVAPLIFTFPDKRYWNLGPQVAEAWSCGKDFRP